MSRFVSREFFYDNLRIFQPGVESQPDFDASLAMNGMKDTFVVGLASGATFVSKPGLIQSPAKTNPDKEGSFLDSFNETFRDYGLEDLCSDSDNTDDEEAPTKPVRSQVILILMRGNSFNNGMIVLHAWTSGSESASGISSGFATTFVLIYSRFRNGLI